MRSVAALKTAYGALSLLFTLLLVTMLRAALATRVDVELLGLALAPAVGVAGSAVAWLGWIVGRRLGLSRSDAGAVALGSVVGGVNVFVLVWILLKRAPASA